MRPKFVAVVLLMTGLIVGAVFFIRSGQPLPVSPDKQSAPVSNTPPVVAAAPTPPPPPPAPVPVIAQSAPTPEERDAAILAEKDKLFAWSMDDDPLSSSNIFNDLSSPEKEIREAAVEAAKQKGDTNAIPILKRLAAGADDSEEAVAMLKAAEFIGLPSADLSHPEDGTPMSPEQVQAAAQRAAAHAGSRSRGSGNGAGAGGTQDPNQNVPAAPQPDNGQ